MSKAAHTPTPWFLQDNTDIYSNIIRPKCFDGMIICYTPQSALPEMRSNAELIVTAVNHHQELITRLYNLKNAIEVKDQALIDLYLYDANKTLSKLIP